MAKYGFKYNFFGSTTLPFEYIECNIDRIEDLFKYI